MAPDLSERMATQEEKSRQQTKFNESVCKTLESIQKHLRKIELIALGALIVFGLDKAPALLELIK